MDDVVIHAGQELFLVTCSVATYDECTRLSELVGDIGEDILNRSFFNLPLYPQQFVLQAVEVGRFGYGNREEARATFPQKVRR